jgi:polar amino acid transport system substrate-binding protein
MRTWFTAVVVGFLAAGCASNASRPSQGERQDLAPTGKLRVALYTGAPASIVQGATLNESKGVGFDLGKELARRIGVPFERGVPVARSHHGRPEVRRMGSRLFWANAGA